MSVESFLEEFQLSNNADIAIVEKLFLKKNKELLASFADIQTDIEVDGACQALIGLHTDFYDYAKIWLDRQRAHYKIKEDHPEAEKLRDLGLGILDDLQAYIIENSRCLFYINWYIENVSRAVTYVKERQTSDVQKQVYNAADLAPIFKRNRQLKDQAMGLVKDAVCTRHVLEKAHEYFAAGDKVIDRYLKPKALDRTKSSMYGALRNKNASRAKQLVSALKEQKKTLSIGGNVDRSFKAFEKAYGLGIQHIEDHFDDLSGAEGKAFVKVEDLEVTLEAQDRELNTLKVFLFDHFLTYAKYRRETLTVLRDQLQVHGPTDDLPYLYSKLITGIATVIADMKQLRTYESETLDQITFLLKNHRQEIDKIRERADAIIEEVKLNFSDYKELENYTLQRNTKN